MKRFGDMRIGSKLITGFMIVAIICGAMGIYSIVNLKQLEKSDSELYEKMTVPIQLMGNISEAVQRQRVNIRQAMMVDDPELTEAELQKIMERRSEINDLSTEFEKTIESDKMRDLYNQFIATREVYKPLQDKSIELVREGKYEEVMILLAEDGEAGIAMRAEMNAIDAMI